MGIVIKGKAAEALLKKEGQPSFLNLVKPVMLQPIGGQSGAKSTTEQRRATTLFERKPETSVPTQTDEPAKTALQTVLPIAERKAEAPAQQEPESAEAQKQEAPLAETARQDVVAEKPGLFIRLRDGEKWIVKEIPANIDMVMIGSDQRTCDICIDRKDAEKNHVAARRIGEQWYIIEAAHAKTMTVNGAKRPQIILDQGSSALIGLGSRRLLITNPKGSGKKLDVEAECKFYAIRLQGGPFKQRLDEAFLIGSHSSCKVQIPNCGEFEGIVFACAGRLFLHSFNAGMSGLCADGAASSEEPKPLHHLSSISFGGKEVCMLELPDGMRDAVGFGAVPPASGRLEMLEMNGPAAGRKFILPENGRSVSVGRAADNFIAIDSLKVSRRHAQLAVYENSIMIIDESSGNGSYVGGERVTRRMLHPGERVHFADRAFLLCHSD